jgi:hypothetical protein
MRSPLQNAAISPNGSERLNQAEGSITLDRAISAKTIGGKYTGGRRPFSLTDTVA